MQKQEADQQAEKNGEEEVRHRAAQFVEQFNRVQHPIGMEKALPAPDFNLVGQ